MSDDRHALHPPDAGAPGDGPTWSAATALLLVVVLFAVLALAAWTGFAFYAPRVGDQVGDQAGGEQGVSETVGLSLPRDRAVVEVASYMAADGDADGNARPTLAEVVEFFALEEDTWPCTVEENFGEAAAARAEQYAQRRLRVGERVTLCLD